MWVWSEVGVVCNGCGLWWVWPQTTIFVCPLAQGTFQDSSYDSVAAELRRCAHSHTPSLCAPSHTPSLCAPSHTPSLCAPSHTPSLCAPSHTLSLCAPSHPPSLCAPHTHTPCVHPITHPPCVHPITHSPCVHLTHTLPVCTRSHTLSLLTCRIQTTLHELQQLRAKMQSGPATDDNSVDEVSVSTHVGWGVWLAAPWCPASSPRTCRTWSHHLT